LQLSDVRVAASHAEAGPPLARNRA